jgi:hypothetical protein
VQSRLRGSEYTNIPFARFNIRPHALSRAVGRRGAFGRSLCRAGACRRTGSEVPSRYTKAPGEGQTRLAIEVYLPLYRKQWGRQIQVRHDQAAEAAGGSDGTS